MEIPQSDAWQHLDLFLRIIIQIPFPLGALRNRSLTVPYPIPSFSAIWRRLTPSDLSCPPAPAPRAHGPQIAGLQARATLTLKYIKGNSEVKRRSVCPRGVYPRQTAGGVVSFGF
jgi:hypothetical protein